MVFLLCKPKAKHCVLTVVVVVDALLSLTHFTPQTLVCSSCLTLQACVNTYQGIIADNDHFLGSCIFCNKTLGK